MAKIKLTKSDIERLLEDNPELATAVSGQPWWIIALKVVAYVIGLVLAGYATPSAVGSITTGVANILNIM